MESKKMDHIMSNNIKNNQVNSVIDNEMNFDSSNSIDNNPIKDTLTIVNIGLRGGKNYIQTLNSVITCLWDSGSTSIMIKHKHINTFKSKMRNNNVMYSMADGTYKTIHDVKVPFSMSEFSSRKITTQIFHVDNERGY